MTTLRTAAQQALEALESAEVDPHSSDAVYKAIAALRAALAEPTLQTCNCRWDGEVQVQQCTLHEAHVDAIHEWAERAKTAEKKLAALAEPVHKGEEMNRDELMALANQTAGQHWMDEAHIQRFAHLVYESVFRDANLAASRTILDAAVLTEREACAKVCESKMPNPVKNWSDAQIVNALRDCAAAIRARSNP